MPTLGDIARQAPGDTPAAAKPLTLGDVARQTDQPPELLRRPEDEAPTPPPQPRRTGEAAGDIIGRRAFVGPYRDRYRFADDAGEGEPAPGPWEGEYVLPDPNAVRQPTWPETIALTGARVVPPILA